MVVAQVEGGILTVEETPSAASLQWIDGPEFRRLLEAHRAPEREPTRPTTR